MTTGRLLFTPEPARRRQRALRLVHVAMVSAMAASTALWVYRMREPAPELPTTQAVVDARIEGFRAGFQAALEQTGCRQSMALAHPLGTR